MNKIERLEVELKHFKQTLKYLTKYKVDKCKGYAPGCPNCAGQLLLGYLYDHIDLLEWELKNEKSDN